MPLSRYLSAFLTVSLGLLVPCTSLSRPSTCPVVDTSLTTVAFIFLPQRFASDAAVFKLHHFYSLLLLTRTFPPSPTHKLLFYYPATQRPTSSHYHQWLTDPFWADKVNLTNVLFAPFNPAKIDNS